MIKVITLIITVTIALFYGVKALSHKSDILIQSIAYCCDNGICQNNNPSNSARCSSSSTGHVKPNCDYEINMTCKDCVDLTYSGCMCSGGSAYCMKDDETLYYGKFVSCDIIPPRTY